MKTIAAKKDFEYGFAQTLFGECFVAWCDGGISDFQFTENNHQQLIDFVALRSSDSKLARNDKAAEQIAKSAFEAPDAYNSMTTWLIGTLFQVEVWEALRTIPLGATTTYSSLAAQIGKPTAIRAVASAVARNPVSYIVPCHRVIRKGGAIGQYRWGHERKVAILEWEKSQK